MYYSTAGLPCSRSKSTLSRAMTFIISAATKTIALQVADTRVTRAANGAVVDDLSIKTTVLHCKDAKLVISFTGLATINGKKTDKWIEEKLVQFEAWEKVFQETMDYLRDEATKALSRDKNLEKYGLEIVVIGLGYSPGSIRQPAIALITNFSEPLTSRNQFGIVNSIGRPFSRYIDPEKVRHYVGISGATQAPKLIINGLRRKFEKQLRQLPETANPRPVLDRLVAMLRLHRQGNPQLCHNRKLLCSGCNSERLHSRCRIIRPKRRQTIIAEYHPRAKALGFILFCNRPLTLGARNCWQTRLSVRDAEPARIISHRRPSCATRCAWRNLSKSSIAHFLNAAASSTGADSDLTLVTVARMLAGNVTKDTSTKSTALSVRRAPFGPVFAL
jgi:hypothetical protein